MTAEMPAAGLEVELDRCIDQLLKTGVWEVRVPPGEAHAELDSLMGVAALLRALTGYITHPRPSQKDRVWASVSNLLHAWRGAFVRDYSRTDGLCTSSVFGLM